MELWKTKEKHKVGKKRDRHQVYLCIPDHSMEYVNKGLELLQKEHGVPLFAKIALTSGWSSWVKAYWTNDH